ncbi:MAG: CpaF family protein [Acidimicrobiales bacterium]
MRWNRAFRLGRVARAASMGSPAAAPSAAVGFDSDSELDAEFDFQARVEAIRATKPLLSLPAARAEAGAESDRLGEFGVVGRLLLDDDVTEVLINGPGQIWIERAGELEPANAEIGHYDIELLIERMLTPLGLRVDRSSPIVDARLADGSRVNVVVPPLAIDGPAISIRRFPSAPIRLSSFGPPAMVRLLRELMAEQASMLVVGPTSSGKTTLLNALSRLIDPDRRIVCIEDTAELQLAGHNVVRLEARPANSEGVGEVPLRRLVLNALRMRPDRLVVGEVRGAEAFDLLLALTSGHRGCLTTCHGADAVSGLRRLETLASLAGEPLAENRLSRLIGDGIDAVVTTARVGPRRLVSSIDQLDGGRVTNRWTMGPTTMAARTELRSA